MQKLPDTLNTPIEHTVAVRYSNSVFYCHDVPSDGWTNLKWTARQTCIPTSDPSKGQTTWKPQHPYQPIPVQWLSALCVILFDHNMCKYLPFLLKCHKNTSLCLFIPIHLLNLNIVFISLSSLLGWGWETFFLPFHQEHSSLSDPPSTHTQAYPSLQHPNLSFIAFLPPLDLHYGPCALVSNSNAQKSHIDTIITFLHMLTLTDASRQTLWHCNQPHMCTRAHKPQRPVSRAHVGAHTLRSNHAECWECSAKVRELSVLQPAINHKILSGDWTADSVGITLHLPLFQSITPLLQKAHRLPNDIGLLSSGLVSD